MISFQVAETLGTNDQETAHLQDLVERAAQATLQHTNTPQEHELAIVITDDVQLHQLNWDFLGIDAPTDVLAFPSDEVDPDTESQYLGDVIISYERAAQQAASEHHSLENELQLLVVHGVLHLLGYDHDNQEQKTRMWAIQELVLGYIRDKQDQPASFEGD
jgi:probable rRNA maturation factor